MLSGVLAAATRALPLLKPVPTIKMTFPPPAAALQKAELAAWGGEAVNAAAPSCLQISPAAVPAHPRPVLGFPVDRRWSVSASASSIADTLSIVASVMAAYAEDGREKGDRTAW